MASQLIAHNRTQFTITSKKNQQILNWQHAVREYLVLCLKGDLAANVLIIIIFYSTNINQLFSLPSSFPAIPVKFHFPVKTQLCAIEMTVQSTADSASTDKEGSKIKPIRILCMRLRMPLEWPLLIASVRMDVNNRSEQAHSHNMCCDRAACLCTIENAEER